MKKVVRTQHITKLAVQVVDLNTEKVEIIPLVLNSWFTSDKIMITKLSEILKNKNMRLISIKSNEKCIRKYTQTLKYFRENAEIVEDEIYQNSNKKEKEN